MVIYECLSGKEPFDRATPEGTILAVAGGDYTPLPENCPELPRAAALQAVIARALSVEPTQRTAFVLFQLEQRPMEEVAALMDASLSATKSRVMWARRKLYARLSKDPRAQGLVAGIAGAGAQSS